MPRTQTRPAASASGAYQLFVAAPAGPAPAGGFPVIYLLDANAAFGTLVEAMRRGAARRGATGIGEAVLVGIGYPGAETYDRTRRTFDYTTGPSAEGAGPATGGADMFLGFLDREVRPMIAREFPIDPGRETLLGHSLAGYFALHVLATTPGRFGNYIAVSPSVWWDERGLRAGFAGLARHAAIAGRPPRVMISVGEWEEAPAPWLDPAVRAEIAERRARRQMVPGARRFAADLAGLDPRLTVRFEELAGEDHASVVPATMSRALRFVFQG